MFLASLSIHRCPGWVLSSQMLMNSYVKLQELPGHLSTLIYHHFLLSPMCTPSSNHCSNKLAASCLCAFAHAVPMVWHPSTPAALPSKLLLIL